MTNVLRKSCALSARLDCDSVSPPLGPRSRAAASDSHAHRLPARPGDEDALLGGTSLMPLMLDGAARVKPHAFSQYARLPKYPDEPWRHNSIDHHDREDFLFMGYSARSEGFRYTEWRVWNGSALQADWSDAGLVGVELYDHTSANKAVSGRLRRDGELQFVIARGRRPAARG